MTDAAYVVLLMGGIGLFPFAVVVPVYALALIWRPR